MGSNITQRLVSAKWKNILSHKKLFFWKDDRETEGGDVYEETGGEDNKDNSDDPEAPDVNGEEVGERKGDKKTISNEGSNIGLIVGVVIPLILLAIIAVIGALVVLFVWKKRYELCISHI